MTNERRTHAVAMVIGHWSLIIVSNVVAGELSLWMTNER